jgi:hypothetical protein
MEEHAGADAVRFSGFRFDRRRGVLWRQNEDGQFVPVPIGSRALDILGLLIDRHGDLVSKDEILNTVWPGVVEGANVTVQISALRHVLDERPLRTEPDPNDPGPRLSLYRSNRSTKRTDRHFYSFCGRICLCTTIVHCGAAVY